MIQLKNKSGKRQKNNQFDQQSNIQAHATVSQPKNKEKEITDDYQNQSQSIQHAGDLIRELYVKLSRIESKKKLFHEFDDLTIIEIETLLVLHPYEMKSMSHIAESLGVTLGTPTITMNRLVAKGYVERIRDLEDRRQVFVKLSPSGIAVFEKLKALKQQLSEKLLSVLSLDELKVLINTLSNININLEDLMNRKDFSVDAHQSA